MQKYQRWQKENLLDALQTRRVVILSGERQCGKTTLVKELMSDDMIYRSLDDAALLRVAKEDPQSFLKHDRKTMIIDEVQRVPHLLMAIKKVVDENPRYGQFLITGSVNIQNLPTVRESLAGRVRKVRLRTLSQTEMLGRKPHFLEKAFKQHFASKSDFFDKDALLDLSFKGGFPEVLNLSHRQRRSWHRDYLEALIENDLNDIAHIKRFDVLADLVRILYAWSSKYMNKGAILSSLAITKQTLDSYIAVLKNMYLFESVEPWLQTDYEYVGKKKKLFANDTGLMSSFLRWNLDDIRLDADRSGKMIETFVYNELVVQAEASAEDYKIYQYRDSERREIDFIIEREGKDLLGIEVKSGSALSGDSGRHLQFFRKKIVGKRNFIGIVLYTGEHVVSFGENMWAVPISALWSEW